MRRPTMMLVGALVLGLLGVAEARPRKPPPRDLRGDDLMGTRDPFDKKRPRHDRAAQRAPRAGKRDKVKARIRAMRAWVVTEQLDLDAATAEKLFPILARYDDELARLLAERKQLRRALEQARQAGGPAIDEALDRLIANQRARWSAEEQRFADLRAVLTPEQAAELLDLLPEVDRKILKGLRDAVEAPGPPPSSAPATRGPRFNPDDVMDPFKNRQ
jgi:hypothetical protein